MIYPAIYDGPPRWYTARTTRKKYIMVHATANTASARAEASYAKRRTTRVSSHYYVDDEEIRQSLDTNFRAWHAGNQEGNDHAIAYELTAANVNVGRAWWLDLDNIEWPLFAGQVARDCREHGIEPRDLTVAQLREGRLTGFCMHYEGNQAWGGSDHTDPGPNFPMDHLVRQVRALLEGEDMPTVREVWMTDGILPAPAGYEDSKNTHWAPGNMLRSSQYWARRAALRIDETVAGQAAILARLDGADEGATRTIVREELGRHRGELLSVLDGLPQEVAAELGDRDAGAVQEAVARVLGRIRVEIEEEVSGS